MASIRTRLTVAYAATLVGTVAVLGAVVYAVQRETVSRELTMRVRSDIDLATRIISQVAASGNPVTTAGDTGGLGAGAGRRGGSRAQVQVQSVPVVSAPVRNLLEGVPDYVLVLDSTQRTLYNSFAVRQLDPDDQVLLSEDAMHLPIDSMPEPVALSDRQLLVVVSRPMLPRTAVFRIAAGVDPASASAGLQELLATDLVLLPVVILISIVIAYGLSGRAFQPVEIIMNEVQAISDGRSLHRRLVVDNAGDELHRLSGTLNEMLARLETSFGGLRRFTADASHELKTPLAVLRADVERAMSAPQHSTEQLVALEEALQEIRRMSDLVDSLLTLARADEGRFDLLREPVALDELVREVYETGVILGEDAGITVSLLVLEPATVLGDAARLRQLCMNLVINAIKYTPRGGRVDVSLSHRLDGITLTVRDTGIGIAASDLPHIFERFWRADRVRSRASERGGFGLGLAISQWIAQAHGGSITVTSRLGRGSVFTVHLPAAEPAPVAEAAAHPASAAVQV